MTWRGRWRMSKPLPQRFRIGQCVRFEGHEGIVIEVEVDPERPGCVRYGISLNAVTIPECRLQAVEP